MEIISLQAPTCPVPPKPTTSILFFGNTRTPREHQEIPGTISKHIIFLNLKIVETQQIDDFGKDGHRKMMKIRLTNSWKSWIWEQYLSKNVKFECGTS